MGRRRQIRTSLRLLVAALCSCAIVLAGGAAATAASNWVTGLSAGGSGEAHAQALPGAPTGVTATCTSPTTASKITVSWTAVAKASSYSVYDATAAATGPYSLIASAVAGTSWTSGALAKADYWFKVVVNIGSHWTSAMSTASAESTINTTSPFCVQP